MLQVVECVLYYFAAQGIIGLIILNEVSRKFKFKRRTFK